MSYMSLEHIREVRHGEACFIGGIVDHLFSYCGRNPLVVEGARSYVTLRRQLHLSIMDALGLDGCWRFVEQTRERIRHGDYQW